MKLLAASALLSLSIASGAEARVYDPNAVICDNVLPEQSTDAVIMVNFHETLTSPDTAQAVFDKKRAEIESVIAARNITPTYIQVTDNLVQKPVQIDLHIMESSPEKKKEIEASFEPLMKHQDDHILHGGIEVHVADEKQAAILLESLNDQGIQSSMRVGTSVIKNCIGQNSSDKLQH
jgi:hypothetical protein